MITPSLFLLVTSFSVLLLSLTELSFTEISLLFVLSCSLLLFGVCEMVEYLNGLDGDEKLQ